MADAAFGVVEPDAGKAVVTSQPTLAAAVERHARGAKRSFKRVIGRALIVLLLLGLGLRAAIHWLPWFGPLLADGLRILLGPEAVARLEEVSASVEDRGKRMLRSSERPRVLRDVGPAPAGAGPQVLPEAPPITPAFKPADVGPVAGGVSAPGDGSWVRVTDPARPAHHAALLFATMLHPDRKRPWAEVFVVAVAVAQVRLHAVAGTVEPEATTARGRAYARQGLIPRAHHEALLAAFNGGFKTEHGRHGMFVDGVTLVPPQDRLCTLVGFDDGRLTIATWKTIAEQVRRADVESRVVFWRQAAPCMVEQGAVNPLLRAGESKGWGATLEGNVVIRRSAVGLSSDQSVLYVAVSNDTTAGAIATAMHHAGASDVAQLDVNWSYPRFLLFPRAADGHRHAASLFKGFLFRDDDYIARPSPRDFFYLVRR